MIARNPDKVKNDLVVMSFDYHDKILTKGEKGAVIGKLNLVFGGDVHRRTALAWLFSSRGEMSTKKLDDGQWYALWDWVGFWLDENNEWQVRPEFPTEAAFVLTEALRANAKVKPVEADKDLADMSDIVAQSVSELGGVVTQVDDLPKTDVQENLGYWLRKKVNDFIDGKDVL